jgi:hypothetical protein
VLLNYLGKKNIIELHNIKTHINSRTESNKKEGLYYIYVVYVFLWEEISNTCKKQAYDKGIAIKSISLKFNNIHICFVQKHHWRGILYNKQMLVRKRMLVEILASQKLLNDFVFQSVDIERTW